MSKSAGNFYTLRDLMGMDYEPEVVRYLLASVPYRKKLNFTTDGLKAAATAIERLRNFKRRLETDKFPEGANEKITQRTGAALHQFEESLDDDLNTAEALGAVYEFVRDANTAMDSGELRQANTGPALDLLKRFDKVFAVLEVTRKEAGISDADVERLIAERAQAKKNRDFARSDQIRQELLNAGVILEDTKEGARWKRK
jgi:cysteinyl-tRNA synthetase